jgi:hypothetical protein
VSTPRQLRRHRIAGPPADRFRAVAAAGIAVSTFLVALSVGTHYLAYRVQLADPGSPPLAVLRRFDVNSERNVPTVWSAALLLGSSVLAVRLHLRSRGRGRQGWLFVGTTTAFLALDEFLELHERLGTVGQALSGNALHFAWVVPGAAAAAVVGAVALVRLRSQPPEVRRRLAVAAGVYLTGALVVETVSGAVLQRFGAREAYVLITAAEELLEMAGACLLLASVAAGLSERPGREV